MRFWLMIVLMLAMVATGCTKKDGNDTVNPSPETTVQPSPGASPTPIGTSGTNGGAVATATHKATSNVTKDVPLPKMTKEQADKISMTSTYDEMVKLTGSKGKLVKDENGKKTYEFEISNQPGYYVALIYFADGKISEKRVFQK